MSLGLQFLHFKSKWVWIVEHLGIIDYVKDIIPFPILFFDFSLMFFKLFLMKKKSFLGICGLQRNLGFQLSTLKVEGQEDMAIGLQLSVPKIEIQKHSSSNLQLLALKVED